MMREVLYAVKNGGSGLRLFADDDGNSLLIDEAKQWCRNLPDWAFMNGLIWLIDNSAYVLEVEDGFTSYLPELLKNNEAIAIKAAKLFEDFQ